MFGGKPPPSLIITTGSEMGSNYGGSPHQGGSFSPSSTSSSSSSPCPSTPSSSTHSFNIHHNHFQPQYRNGDGIPPLAKCGMGQNGERNQSRFMHKRGGRPPMNHPFNNYGPPPPPPPLHPNQYHHNRPPFFNHPPPFPHPMMFPPPPRFSKGPPPSHFFPPPAYSPHGLPDTSVPPPLPPPYTSVPPPFMMGYMPPPPHPSIFNRPPPSHSPNGGQRGNQKHAQQERNESRPPSREGGASLASTEFSYGGHSNSDEGSSESSTGEDEMHLMGRTEGMRQRTRSYLVHLRPESKRNEPSSIPLPIGEKEFEIFTSILTQGNKNVKDTEIMDRFIVEFMKLEM